MEHDKEMAAACEALAAMRLDVKGFQTLIRKHGGECSPEIIAYLDEHMHDTHHGANCAHVAAESGSAEILYYIMKQHPDLLSMVDSHGGTLAMYAAHCENEEVWQLVAQHDSVLCIIADCEGKTPAMHAAQRGNIAMLQWLQDDQQRDLGALCNAGKNVTDYALESKREATAKWLLCYGYEPCAFDVPSQLKLGLEVGARDYDQIAVDALIAKILSETIFESFSPSDLVHAQIAVDAWYHALEDATLSLNTRGLIRQKYHEIHSIQDKAVVPAGAPQSPAAQRVAGEASPLNYDDWRNQETVKLMQNIKLRGTDMLQLCSKGNTWARRVLSPKVASPLGRSPFSVPLAGNRSNVSALSAERSGDDDDDRCRRVSY